MMIRRRRQEQFRWITLVLILSLLNSACLGSSNGRNNDGIDGRYSFSLTTFDPSGRLGQVLHGIQASTLGTPIIAVAVAPSGSNTSPMIVMSSPQLLPSPFIKDDGTSRFCKISNNIMIGHSGLSADGRVIIASAQRFAMEYEYLNDETIPIDFFLEEVSSLFQEYTMKPGARPFGVTLLVGFLPNDEDNELEPPKLYRIDPSGAVESLGNYAVVNGNILFQSNTNNKQGSGDDGLIQSLENLVENAATLETDEGRTDTLTSSEDRIHNSLVHILRNAVQEKQEKQPSADDSSVIDRSKYTILTASLSSSSNKENAAGTDGSGNNHVIFSRRRHDDI